MSAENQLERTPRAEFITEGGDFKSVKRKGAVLEFQTGTPSLAHWTDYMTPKNAKEYAEAILREVDDD